MIISIEGPDGAGKSTLVRELTSSIDCEAFYSGRPISKSQMEYLVDQVEDMFHDDRKIWMMDRNPLISELIYSKVLNRECLISQADMLRMLSLKHKVVFCLPRNISSKLIDDSYKAHKPAEFLERVKKNHNKIIGHYRKMMASDMIKTSFKTHWYDHQKDGSHNELMKFLSEK